MGRIDLDAVHRAQEEAEGEPSVLVLGDREFKLNSHAPAGFLVGLGRMQQGQVFGFEQAVKSILHDPTEFDDVVSAGLRTPDLEEIARSLYGVDVGEASASG